MPRDVMKSLSMETLVESLRKVRENRLSQGYILKDYEILCDIGRGGSAVVYMGRHQELKIDVAIKEYFPADSHIIRQNGTLRPGKPDLQDFFKDGFVRFCEEAKLLKSFRDCPNIVTYRDFFRANGTAYMVMEYVSESSLFRLLERREPSGYFFTEQELLALIRSLLTGLTVVHESGVCHRDINPSNILVRDVDQTPILIDFGAARHGNSQHIESIAPCTEGYAAPEQVCQGKIGSWTDIYAVGAVMWRVVAGGNPSFLPPNRQPSPILSRKRTSDLMQGHKDPMRSARELGRGRFSDGLLQTIDDCLILNASERVQNCSELLDRLDKSERVAVRITDLPSTL